MESLEKYSRFLDLTQDVASEARDEEGKFETTFTCSSVLSSRKKNSSICCTTLCMNHNVPESGSKPL